MANSIMNPAYYLSVKADEAGMTAKAKLKLVKGLDTFRFNLDNELFDTNETTIYDYDDMAIMEAYWNGKSITETVIALTATDQDDTDQVMSTTTMTKERIVQHLQHLANNNFLTGDITDTHTAVSYIKGNAYADHMNKIIDLIAHKDLSVATLDLASDLQGGRSKSTDVVMDLQFEMQWLAKANALATITLDSLVE